MKDQKRKKTTEAKVFSPGHTFHFNHINRLYSTAQKISMVECKADFTITMRSRKTVFYDGAIDCTVP